MTNTINISRNPQIEAYSELNTVQIHMNDRLYMTAYKTLNLWKRFLLLIGFYQKITIHADVRYNARTYSTQLIQRELNESCYLKKSEIKQLTRICNPVTRLVDEQRKTYLDSDNRMRNHLRTDRRPFKPYENTYEYFDKTNLAHNKWKDKLRADQAKTPRPSIASSTSSGSTFESI